MPELAEVAYHASRWRQAVGERFSLRHLSERARCCRELERESLQGAVNHAALEEGHTHGKRMLFGFEGGVWLELHLGMTGSLDRLGPNDGLEKHDHLILASLQSQLVFRDPRQFGRAALSRSPELPQWWRELPPEPQSPGFTRARFEAICKSRSRARLKPVLLEQELFPGVGNWMADEILWQARLRPDRLFGSLDDRERRVFYRRLRSVCRTALATVGRDYSDPPESWLFRHRWRPGGICPKTGQPLARSNIGGRSTCWSPSWQR